LGAYYYITLQSGQGRTAFTLQLNQHLTVTNLEGGLIQKQQYWDMAEQVKLYYFSVPNWIANYRVVINVQALTEQFYPIILLYKNQLTSSVSDPTQLTYPTMQSYNLSFGDQFYSSFNKNNFTYQFLNIGSNYAYFTMAIYNFQYGMTDKRKPEFKL